MTRPLPPRHERLRRHREVFLFAQQLGVTPREAEAELDRRAAAERWEATRQRMSFPRTRHDPPAAEEAAEPRPKYWWQRPDL